MNRSSFSGKELAEKLKSVERGGVDTDMMVWSFLERRDRPLAPYDEEEFWVARSSGHPSTMVTTDVGAAMDFLEDKFSGSRIDMRAERGMAEVKVNIPVPDGIGVSGHFKGKAAASDIGRAVACALVEGYYAARDLDARLGTVRGMAGKVKPYAEWDVVRMGSGYYAAVNHEDRLLGPGYGSEHAVRKNGLDLERSYTILSCRERYEKRMPVPERDIGNETGDGPGM